MEIVENHIKQVSMQFPTKHLVTNTNNFKRCIQNVILNIFSDVGFFGISLFKKTKKSNKTDNF